MEKYIRYLLECIRMQDTALLNAAFRYFFMRKLPNRDMVVHNPNMGSFFCRRGTTDFMYSFKAYEYRVKGLISQHLPKCDAFFDIGACIGDYSIWVGRQGIPSYAFEPLQENYLSLQQNIQRNGLEDRVKTFPYGLGSKTEALTFQANPTNKGYSGRYLEVEDAVAQEVAIQTLDTFFEEQQLSYDRFYIIKIDAEGMELEVLHGAVRMLQQVKKLLLIFEAHTQSKQVLNFVSEYTDYQPIAVDALNMAVVIER